MQNASALLATAALGQPFTLMGRCATAMHLQFCYCNLLPVYLARFPPQVGKERVRHHANTSTQLVMALQLALLGTCKTACLCKCIASYSFAIYSNGKV
jgi:hypothetical protein